VQPVEPVPPVPAQGSRWPVYIVAAALVIGTVLIVYKVTHHEQTPDVSKIDETPSETASPAAPASSTPAPAATAKPSAATQGSVAREVEPDVPTNAQNTIQGTIKITVRVVVDESGKVTEAKLTSPGHSPYFANLAIGAARQWEFSPPQVDGQPVPSTWNLHFQFKRSGNRVTSARAR